MLDVRACGTLFLMLPLTLKDWGDKQPNGGVEDCVCLRHGDDFRWNDYPCSYNGNEMYPLCEIK